MPIQILDNFVSQSEASVEAFLLNNTLAEVKEKSKYVLLAI
jgi:hypothetical protein